MDDGRGYRSEDTESLSPDGKISRRAMVAGTVATTALTIFPLSNSAFAQTPGQEDMVAFLMLSSALTGIDIQTLAPEFSRGTGAILSADPGVDPINVKSEYFSQVAKSPAFAKLLKIAKDSPNSSVNIIAEVNASDEDTKSLARSIVLLWYLGTWYAPDVLKNAAHSPESVDKPLDQEVLSAKAYTQGLVWLIVGAHPMGYSNLQFGYWSRDPHDPNSEIKLFSPVQF